MTKKVIIWAFFNIDPGWKNNPYKEARLTKEWIDYRMNIFMKYTCQSLRAQSSQDFTAFIIYDLKTKSLIDESLEHYPVLPDNIRFVTNLYAETSRASVGYDKLYHMRIDSDNMIHPAFVKSLHDAPVGEETEVILPQKGYMYEAVENGMCEFIQDSPPFYTLIYTPEEYRVGKTFSTKVTGHMDMIKLRHYILEDHMYIVLVHKKNVLNRFGDQFCPRVIEDEEEKQAILKLFNILQAKKVSVGNE